jgi:uncharacterized membrane-anchored protein
MTTTRAETGIFLYLSAVIGLAVVAISLSVVLLTRNLLPGFGPFLQHPIQTIQGNLVGVGAVAGVVASILALIAVIVIFGARYAQTVQTRARTDESPSRSER